MPKLLLRLVREPLIHFSVLGLALFAGYFALNPDQFEPEIDPKTVIVDETTILKFLQFRIKEFDDKLVRDRFNALSLDEKDKLVKDYIREEVLYREALSLNLDKTDYIIKRRMIQKLDFIAEGFAESVGRPTDEYVRSYYDKNKQDYYVEPWITFTHVFFDKNRLGSEVAITQAGTKLTELNTQKAIFSDAVKHGNRFLYHTNYVERTLDFVGSHFGKHMATELFNLKPNKTKWHGPIKSTYGSHIVMVVARQKGAIPPLEEVRGRVEADAHRNLVRERTEKTVQKIIDSYTINNTIVGLKQ